MELPAGGVEAPPKTPMDPTITDAERGGARGGRAGPCSHINTGYELKQENRISPCG